MTRIYIIRHAEAEGNIYRRIHGWYDSLITERGYRQIAALADRFQNVHVDAVYSSDRFRTKTTASAIYKPKGLELHTSRQLREVNMGIWEDHPWGEVARTDTEQLKLFNAGSSLWRTEGGESYAEVQKRLVDAVLRIAKNHPGQTVAAASHGTAIRSMLAYFHGLPLDRMSEVSHCDNTGVACLEVEGDRVNIVFENDNSHLDEATSTFASQSWWRMGGKGSLDEVNLWFRPLDFETEAELYYQSRKEAWVTIHGSLLNFDGDGFLRDAMAQSKRDQRSVMVAMKGETIAGILQMDFLRDAEKGVGGIPFYYMTPEFRRRGFGVQLLGQAVSTYRPMGRTYLRLRCAPDNLAAQRFYQRHGFRKVAEEQGSRVPLDIMEKYIGYDRAWLSEVPLSDAPIASSTDFLSPNPA